NGATARTRWKAARRPSNRVRRLPASTGPPRERGGKGDWHGHSLQAWPASTGPPRERGGKGRPPAGTRTRTTSFNGATARTRWKVWKLWYEKSATKRLQRGHRANAVERRDDATIGGQLLRFNGATARTRWKVAVADALERQHVRFNG